MADYPEEFGVVGLGRMGGGLALQAAEKGIRVVGYDVQGVRDEMRNAGIVDIVELAGFRDHLQPPRAVFAYVPAGLAVDEVITELSKVLEPGDIIVDGGNSYWGDSIRRSRKLKEHGLQFIDLGTSGGVDGARYGACFMVGGEREAVARIEPMLLKLAVAEGYVHAGPAGAGHFTKLVHNGIEFGMLQAIAEGVDLLEHYQENLPIADVLKCWRHGSVIRSWLVDLMEQSYRQHNGMKTIPPYIEDTGEVNWLITDALQMERPVPVISQAIMQLLASRDESKDWARAIAMMRHGFGGHPFGPDQHVRQERQLGRIGDFWRSGGS
jgi:6-phosphogluconate dehydrogenase